jgi:CheY-like chemotaxis protein
VAQLAAGCELLGDPERLAQVVTNLLSNALKFTPHGGTVTVALAESQGSFTLTVSDTGKGIERERLPHLFDFVRLRQTAAEGSHAGGLGLGLTLVHEIVSLHGGTVSARSAGPGTGATFEVHLPAAPPGSGHGGGAETGETGISRAPRHSEHLKGLTVLVVDDDADARNLVAQSLRQEGAQVTVSDGAIAAYEQLKARSFDIVVTDIGMPGMDGYALVRALRKLARGSRALAIAVTGLVGRGDVAAARDAGFDLHFPKPLDLGTFVPMVRRLVRP